MLTYLIATLLIACLVFSPMSYGNAKKKPQLLLAKNYQPHHPVSEYLISEKLDGVRAFWDGSRFLTRSGHQIKTPDWFTKAFPKQPLDGELWMGRGRFAEVSGQVRRKKPNDQEWRKIRFMVFDLPAYPGNFKQRHEALVQLVQKTQVNWLQAVRQERLNGQASLQNKLKNVVQQGGEGLMLHLASSVYIPGRNESLLKLKPLFDAEARVTGHLPGKGKYKNMLGALIVELEDGRPLKIGTGFTDAERSDPPPVGSMITYEYSGLTVTGLPRFARFVRVYEEN